jgi:MFS family permease
MGMVTSGTVLTLLLRDLGTGRMMIGLIGSIEGLAMLLPQILGNYIFTSRRHLKKHLVNWHIFIIVPFLFVMSLLLYGSARLPASWLRWGLLVSWGCFNLTVGAVASSWIDWVGQVFMTRIRGLAVGITLAAAAAAGTVSAVVAAKLIMLDPSVSGYARHYLLAGIIACVAMTVFYLVDDPSTHAATSTTRDWRRLMGSFRASLADRNFRAYLMVRALGIVGFAMLPFVSMHFGGVEGGGLSTPFIVRCGAIQALCVAVMQIVLGMWGDRRGHREGLLLGLGLQVATLLVALTLRGPASCLLTFALAGAAIGSVTVSSYNLNLETCRHDTRVAHLNLTNLLVAVPLMIGPLLCGMLSSRFDTKATFVCCIIFSLLAIVLLLTGFHEPRKVAGEKVGERG